MTGPDFGIERPPIARQLAELPVGTFADQLATKACERQTTARTGVTAPYTGS